MKKAHALHNEELYDFLLSTKKYNDWVITTAFYSALHFVQHELFPRTEEGNTYADFNEYYGKILKRMGYNKHSGTIYLVRRHLPACSSVYRRLYDRCMDARYKEYHVTESTAVETRRDLSTLKSYLSK
ncbi:MAG: hypothetical protein V4543_06995 [Bacteroidota bacterium]